MKKKSGLGRALHVVPVLELEGFTTGALVARLKRLRWCEESRDDSDLTDSEIDSVKGMILFKNTIEWKQAYEFVKSVLKKREHLHPSK